MSVVLNPLEGYKQEALKNCNSGDKLGLLDVMCSAKSDVSVTDSDYNELCELVEKDYMKIQ